MDGIFIIDKPLGVTSFHIVSQIKKLMNTKKVGHCGTLDPMASGVLVICVNKATKISQFIMSDDKYYEATIKLGQSTDTYDQEGRIVKEMAVPSLNEQLILDILHQFEGTISQLPPIYSAIKVNGKKLYEYARSNQEVEIKPRMVTINQIELLHFTDQTISIRVHCSKGTYIRSLCHDLAIAFGTVGYMSELRRTRSGCFDISQAKELNDLSIKDMISIKDALKDYQSLTVDNEIDVKNGKQIKSDLEGITLILNQNKEVLAIYEQIGNGYLKSVRGIW